MVSTVPAEGEGVAAAPGGTDGGAELVGADTLLAETTVLAAGGGEATELTVLVAAGDDPVDAGVTADGGVGRINEDALVPVVDRVLWNNKRR